MFRYDDHDPCCLTRLERLALTCKCRGESPSSTAAKWVARDWGLGDPRHGQLTCRDFLTSTDETKQRTMKKQAILVGALLLVVAGVSFFAGRGCRNPDPELALARQRIDERNTTIDSLEALSASIRADLSGVYEDKARADSVTHVEREARLRAQERFAAIRRPDTLSDDALATMANDLMEGEVVRVDSMYMVSRPFVEVSVWNHSRVGVLSVVVDRLMAENAAQLDQIATRASALGAEVIRARLLESQIVYYKDNQRDYEDSIARLTKQRRRGRVWKLVAVGATTAAVAVVLTRGG